MTIDSSARTKNQDVQTEKMDIPGHSQRFVPHK